MLGLGKILKLFFTYYIIRKRRVSLFLIIRVFSLLFSIFKKMLGLGKKFKLLFTYYMIIRVSLLLLLLLFFNFLSLGKKKFKLFFTY
jgi:hypothetical protein